MSDLKPLQPTGHVGSAETDLWAKGGIEPFELACKFRLYIHLRGSGKAARQNGREPKLGKGFGGHGNQ
jgi:hypothetical protein